MLISHGQRKSTCLGGELGELGRIIFGSRDWVIAWLCTSGSRNKIREVAIF